MKDAPAQPKEEAFAEGMGGSFRCAGTRDAQTFP
eukprot:CAMPEP_0172543902 /NCGR_PEP_ID=MMETSP1067-20121228/14185_1 /TAXON_ID=265564 ORGANISM="Thalassiosira punctigera, Strain Tpunct2005C2" /NCGR_SAMPLE_ID=MMETSP1067 /ASSEMBLY_ACC=CAM_ASM_000444 /LENGTH=33 /DNA_ID= /DNA_START= /DNA_END= /DNA_ORIENTATION=